MHSLAIDFYVRHLYPIGGGENSAIAITKGLVKLGHRVTIRYLESGSLGYQFIKAGAKLKHISESSLKCDIAYCNNIDFYFGALELNQPFVQHIRQPADMRLSTQLPRLDDWLRYARPIYISKSQKADWQVLYSGLADGPVVYNAVARVTEQYPLANGYNSVCYIGRLDKGKGLKTLIDAMERLQTHLLHVYGQTTEQSPGYGELLKQYASSLSNVTFHGFLLDKTSVNKAYQANSIHVLPSDWAEPFGRSAIEAIANGRISIGSDRGALPELLPDSNIFKAGDARHLARLIARAKYVEPLQPEMLDEEAWAHNISKVLHTTWAKRTNR